MVVYVNADFRGVSTMFVMYLRGVTERILTRQVLDQGFIGCDAHCWQYVSGEEQEAECQAAVGLVHLERWTSSI